MLSRAGVVGRGFGRGGLLVFQTEIKELEGGKTREGRTDDARRGSRSPHARDSGL